MSHHTVSEVMTGRVVTVTEETPFKALAVLMARRRISALPVLGRAGRVTGVVTEADLLAKQESKDDPLARRLPWWRRWAHHGKARGLTARDVMTPRPATIAPGESVVAAARALDRRATGHLLVTWPGGELAGIVSRSDLLAVLTRPDRDIEDEITRDVFTTYLRTNPALVHVHVTGGVATLSGEVTEKSMIPAAVQMSGSVDGVVDVKDQLTYAVDDTIQPSAGLRAPALTALGGTAGRHR